MVARTDLPFMMHTIPHLVRMCNFPFVQRLLAIDTAPLTGDKVNRPGIGTLEQLQECCNRLLAAGVVDTVRQIDYSDHYRDRVYRKHLGSAQIRQTHNYKGYPILGTIFSLEETVGDYILHFDSDMLLYQKPGYSWIEQAIAMLQTHPEIIAIRPLAGPPHAAGPQQEKRYEYDADEFYRFNTFGSRAYLIDRRRFEALLPLPILWRSYRNKILNHLPAPVQTSLNYVTGKGSLDSWEIMVTNALRRSACIRANLASAHAWTLHPKDRGDDFIHALPQIIEKIESGWYPPEQAGYYDVQLEPWLVALRSPSQFAS
jgi:hypothetical protein